MLAFITYSLMPEVHRKVVFHEMATYIIEARELLIEGLQ